MHSTDNLNDGYVGSGKRLWYSINKHGKENHVCEILEFCKDRQSLKSRETEIVNEEMLQTLNCMNLALGGGGSSSGFENINDSSNAHIERCKKGRHNADKILFEKYGKDFRKVMGILAAKSHTQESRKLAGKNALNTIFEKYEHGYTLGINHTNETKQKISTANKGRQTGRNNSQYGTCWIYSEIEQINKKILKEDLYLYLNDGWKQGRKIPF